MRKLLCLYLLLSFTTFSFGAPTQKFRLDNGLNLLVKEVDRAGIVVAMVWYKIGSADEHGGITGISHVLEHMMFKGTPTTPPNAYSKIIARNGGQENAFTSKDYTAYFAKIAAKKLPKFLELEADRMRHLTLSADEFAKEIKVVREERRMRIDDNPQALTYERLMASTHLAAPYHHPTIGWMNDLENMTVKDLRAWYETWYSPNNATIVVVGDVKPHEVYKLVKNSFGGLKSNELPTRKPQLEPKPLGKREISISSSKAKIPLLAIGYNTPSISTSKKPWHAYALEVLSGVLSGGESARLQKKLVRGEHLASQAEAYYDLYARYDTQFILFAVPASAKDLPKLRQALLNEVAELKNTLVDEKELQRIKNQVIAAKVYEKDSLFGQAIELGMLETIGVGHEESNNYLKKIEAVTAEQIQEVAKLYLTEKRLSIATLHPVTKGEAQ